MDWMFVILGAASGILFTLGDVFLKYWASKSPSYYLVLGFLFYILAGTVLAFSFKRKELAVAIAVLICFNLITVSILGFTIFKETLGVKEFVGMGLAIAAVVVLSV
jgi:multidrug transporter EmrE-like cation transporter